ncbi:hypothetical protein OJ628_04410 [Salmonella enterica subsp. enterica]|nr:hypothetical protein OJ628_04410 [Salmonella enterica subsp. enterica]
MSNVTHQPKIGFVSLGCPKNLVDSERILTELRTEGYDVVPRYDDADMVIVNTCGFIDSAVQESLEAIGEALNENGKVIVTAAWAQKKIRSAKCIRKYWKSPGRIAMSKFCSTYIITYRSRSTIHF